MRSGIKTLMACLFILSMALFLASCGGSSGGDSSSPPAGNVSGTWSVTETATSWGTCEPGGALPTDFYDLIVTHDGVSNTITVRDTRAVDSVTATISGDVVTFNNERYNIAPADCDTMWENGSVTVNAALTQFSGTGSITCSWTDLGGGSCSLNTTLVGIKQ